MYSTEVDVWLYYSPMATYALAPGKMLLSDQINDNSWLFWIYLFF